MQPAYGASQANGDDDIQRRLSEVIAHVHGAPPQPAPGIMQESPRQTWVAAGNVRIEEGFAPPSSNGAHGRPQAGSAGEAPRAAGTAQGFAAAPPAEMPRSARRMPGVEDFPPIAQREWHSKQNVSGGAAQDARKGSLLSRITGLGKRPVEPNHSAQDAQNHAADQAFPQQSQVARESR
jgi:cell division protein FtsZ